MSDHITPGSTPGTAPPAGGSSDSATSSAAASSPVSQGEQGHVSYSERLWVPLWWWPMAFAAVALLAAEIHIAADFLPVVVVFAVLSVLPTWALLWLSRTRVTVTSGPEGVSLRAGTATLPAEFISRLAEIPASAKSAAMGRQLDPAAYLQHRAWVGTMVLVVLDDPDDPTPYWLVSTRRPKALIAALDGAQPRAS